LWYFFFFGGVDGGRNFDLGGLILSGGGFDQRQLAGGNFCRRDFWDQHLSLIYYSILSSFLF
jgi:hypothetical protein